MRSGRGAGLASAGMCSARTLIIRRRLMLPTASRVDLLVCSLILRVSSHIIPALAAVNILVQLVHAVQLLASACMWLLARRMLALARVPRCPGAASLIRG